MMPTLSKTETNIKLPFSFIFYSLVAFSISQVLLIFSGSFVSNGVFRIPHLWMIAHLLLLGWALMVAMGAMYQLVPVVFLTPIWNETFGFIQFVITAVGITAFALSLAFSPAFIIVSGSLTFIGILMFFFQMIMTIRKQSEKNIFTLLVGSGLVCLLLAISLGILLSASIGGNISLANHVAVLKSHIVLGVAGWFTLLIFGFSYKMVPMFSLSHGFSMKLSKPVLIIYLFGLSVTIASFWLESNGWFQLGLILLFIAFSIFVWHIKEIIDKRLKKNLDKPFMFSLLAILIGWGIHLASVILAFISVSQVTFGIILYLYTFGWIIFSILGYLYKIVPFLWWTYRYSKEMGKPGVPTLKQLMNEKLGLNLFIIFLVCLIGLIIAFTFQLPTFYTLVQFIIATASIIFCTAIINVVRK
ncbi:hypothetical protein [Calidifontibacillus oryziterrae]|uniref:hypothetical protein n=1 Tax=Calidifontibacillus oryziterrae TaxID=1191699 RepID=UPI0004781EB3|nr:hypothetical protein [Calidifontibacillus oryziterrae]